MHFNLILGDKILFKIYSWQFIRMSLLVKQDKCKILWKMIPVIANKIIVFCVASLQRPSRPLALVYKSVSPSDPDQYFLE